MSFLSPASRLDWLGVTPQCTSVCALHDNKAAISAGGGIGGWQCGRGDGESQSRLRLLRRPPIRSTFGLPMGTSKRSYLPTSWGSDTDWLLACLCTSTPRKLWAALLCRGMLTAMSTGRARSWSMEGSKPPFPCTKRLPWLGLACRKERIVRSLRSLPSTPMEASDLDDLPPPVGNQR